MPSQAERIGLAMRRELARQVRALLLDIDRELRRLTPIDTGHARRNWVPSVSAPHSGEVQDMAAHDQGVAQVLSYVLEQGPLWLANSVGYVQTLNYGHSKQRAAGWIELGIDLGLQKAQARASNRIDVSAIRAGIHDTRGGEGAENLAGAYNPLGGDE